MTDREPIFFIAHSFLILNAKALKIQTENIMRKDFSAV